MSTREIILRTRKNILFNFNTQSVEDALNIYIKNVLGFNRGFEMSETAWQALSNLATSKPISVKLDLVNGLCKFSRDRIDEIIVGSSSYPTITPNSLIYQVAENNEYAIVSGCTDSIDAATSIIIESKYDGLPVSSIESGVFMDKKNLTTIEIPDSVINIGFRAFFGCSALKKLTIPDAVVNISRQAFAETTIYNDETNWENGVLYINNHLIAADSTQIGNSYVVKSGTRNISEQAFKNCETLEQITLPDGLISINKEAFDNCNKITEFIIPNSVTSIGSMAVHNCKALTQITLPFIGSGAQLNSPEYTHIGWIFGAGSHISNQYVLPSALKSVTITAPCKQIGNNAFFSCSKLKNIIIPDSVTNIGDSAFESCTGLTEITIPASVISMGENIFKNCTNLETINFQGKPSYIATGLFSRCENLTKFVVPSSVSTINAEAFYNCIYLTEITIPVSVTRIDKNAFRNCISLSAITYLGTEEQWNNIEISSGNDALLEATKSFTTETN